MGLSWSNLARAQGVGHLFASQRTGNNEEIFKLTALEVKSGGHGWPMTAPLISTSVHFCGRQIARRAPPGDYTPKEKGRTKPQNFNDLII